MVIFVAPVCVAYRVAGAGQALGMSGAGHFWPLLIENAGWYSQGQRGEEVWNENGT